MRVKSLNRTIRGCFLQGDSAIGAVADEPCDDRSMPARLGTDWRDAIMLRSPETFGNRVEASMTAAARSTAPALHHHRDHRRRGRRLGHDRVQGAQRPRRRRRRRPGPGSRRASTATSTGAAPGGTPTGAGQIDLVFHEFDSAWAMEIIRGVEAVAAAAGIGVVARPSSTARTGPPQRWLDGVLARRPLGVLFVLCTSPRPAAAAASASGIPFVVVDTDSATSASVPTVGVEQLERRPARHPAPARSSGTGGSPIISGPPDVLCSRARAAGFRSAHDEAGLAGRPDAGPLRQLLRRRRLRARDATADRPDRPDRDLRRVGHAGHGRAPGRPPARPASARATCR